MQEKSNVSAGVLTVVGMASFLLVAVLVGNSLTSNTVDTTGVLSQKIDHVANRVSELSGAVDQLAAVSGFGLENKKNNKPDNLSNTLLLRFKPGVSENAMENIFKNSGVTVVDEVDHINVKVLRVPEHALDQVQKALTHNPRVEFVEVNELVEPAFVPNDPEYPNQWHHGVIGSPIAWDSASNTQMVIAVADTGVNQSQPDLSGIVLPGFNTVDNSTDTSDINNHGTWVAGAVAAIGNNATQVTGVAYGAQILPVRITNRTDSYAYFSDMAQGIVYAADHGARIVNLSFHGAAGSASVQNAGAYMKSKGGLTFVAAGNENTDYGYAEHAGIIVVSATGSGDSKASFSSYGNFVDLAAPGVGIRTTARGGGTQNVSGTSFSAPIAAGVAGLVWSVNPTLDPDTVEQIIKDSAKDLGASGWDKYYGWGRVDAAAAVALAATMGGPLPDTTAPTASFAQPQSSTVVSGVTPVSVTATDDVAVDRVEVYAGTRSLGVDSTEPYEFSVDTNDLANGQLTFEARVYDTSENMTVVTRTVQVENVADVIAPVVSVVSPADGGEVNPKKPFSINVTATDNVLVSEIDILFDGVIRSTCTDSSSCSVSINARKESKGAHTITAVAYDAAGNSAVVDSTVNIGGTSTDDTSTDSGDSGKPVKCSPWPSCR